MQWPYPFCAILDKTLFRKEFSTWILPCFSMHCFFPQNGLCFYCDLLAGTSESWRNRIKLHLLSLLHTRKIEENLCFLMIWKARKCLWKVIKGLASWTNLQGDHQWYPSLLKKMCMSVMRGLESNHGFASFEERTVIISLNSIYCPSSKGKLAFISAQVLWVQQQVLNISPELEELLNPWQTAVIGNLSSIPTTCERAQPDHRRPPGGNQPGQKREVQGMTQRWSKLFF